MASKTDTPGSLEKPGLDAAIFVEHKVNAETQNVDYSGAHEKTDPKEIALVRKLDWWIMPILWLMYWLNYLVRLVAPCYAMAAYPTSRTGMRSLLLDSTLLRRISTSLLLSTRPVFPFCSSNTSSLASQPTWWSLVCDPAYGWPLACCLGYHQLSQLYGPSAD